jgi:hypothetical protein
MQSSQRCPQLSLVSTITHIERSPQPRTAASQHTRRRNARREVEHPSITNNSSHPQWSSAEQLVKLCWCGQCTQLNLPKPLILPP